MYGFGKGGHQTPILVCNLNGSLLPTSNVRDSDCDWMATRFTRASHFAHAMSSILVYTQVYYSMRFAHATRVTRAMRPLILYQKQKTNLNDTQLKGGHSVDK